MIKKIICVILTAALLSGCLSVMAAEYEISAQINAQGDAVIIQAQTDEELAGRNVSLVVLYPEAEDSPQGEITVENARELIYYQAQAAVGADGKFSLQVKLSNNVPAGFYRVRTAVYGVQSSVTDKACGFNFVSSEAMQALIAGLNSAGLSDIDAIMNDITTALNVSDANYNRFKAVINKKMIAAREIADGYDSGSEIRTTIYSLILNELLNEGTGGYAALERYLSILGIAISDSIIRKFDDVKALFRGDSERVLSRPSDIGDFMNNASILYLINHASRSEMKNVITDFKNMLWSNESIYEKYKALFSNDEKLMRVNAEVTGKGFDSIGAFKDKLEAAINSVSTGKEQNSSSGGGSRGVVSAVVNQQQPTEKAAFSDLDGVEWAKDSIAILAEKNFIAGVSDNRFAPNDNITREQFVKILVNVFGLYDENAKCEFDDVGKSDWFYKYVASASQTGIVNGVDETTFGVGQYISRQDLAVMIYRTLKNKAVSFEAALDTVDFDDYADIADYSRDAVGELQSAQIINGRENNFFKPLDFCTRAEAAVILARVYKLI